MTRRRDDAPRPAPYAVRIGSAERDRASEDLAVHYAEGRLEHEEYAERLDAIWSSRTRDDLLYIFADLPARSTRAAAPVVANDYRRKRPSGFPWLPAMLVLVALSLMLEAPVVLLVVPWWLLWRRREARRTTRHLTAAGHRHLHG